LFLYYLIRNYQNDSGRRDSERYRHVFHGRMFPEDFLADIPMQQIYRKLKESDNGIPARLFAEGSLSV